MSDTNTTGSTTLALRSMQPSTPVSVVSTDAPAKSRFVHQPGGPVTINTPDADNPAITLHEAYEFTESMIQSMWSAFPKTMPQKPSDQPFTLADGTVGCYTEVETDGYRYTHKELTKPDGQTKGYYLVEKLRKPHPRVMYNGYSPTKWTEIEEYKYATQGDRGVETRDGQFRFFKVEDGSTDYIPVKLLDRHRLLFPRPQDSTTAISENEPCLDISTTTPNIPGDYRVSQRDMRPLSGVRAGLQDLVSYKFVRLGGAGNDPVNSPAATDANVEYASYTVPRDRDGEAVISTDGPVDFCYSEFHM